jgi:3-hydroxy-3-methylglutaryl CoA synthase/uncharacterized OB-fold protein
MRGILSYSSYVPYRRLARSAIAEVLGGQSGKGTRSVASFDEDTTTMGVEAARHALDPGGRQPDELWFATAAPAYLDKTNATAIHAALRLDSDRPAIDMGGAVRSGVGALRAALDSSRSVLVVTSDMRTGLPTSADESSGGDGASAILVGGESDGPVLAEYLGGASATEEFVDRWRAPGDIRSKVWEERFGETEYLPLAERAWNDGLKAAAVTAEQVDHAVVTGTHARAVRQFAARLGTPKEALVDDLSATVGNTGTAHPGMLLASALDGARPGQVIALVVLADGADVLVFRAGDAVTSYRPARPVAAQVEAGANISYGKFLSWRGLLPVEPPRRPEPERISASASARSEAWKYAFVGSRDRTSGAIHLPPARVSMKGDAVDDMEPVPMADVPGTVVTFTVDRLVYSPSPPVVFSVIDFDGGGRFACDLTDVEADELSIGDRVEMTFRRISSGDGIHNYFWKARPIRIPRS